MDSALGRDAGCVSLTHCLRGFVSIRAKRMEIVQMAPSKGVDCSKARGMAETKAILFCGGRYAVVSYQESDCTFTDMGRYSAATVKTHVFCVPRK